jgi:hypothetical protein
MGVGIRQLCDIVLFAKKHDNEIDWGFVNACVKKADIVSYTRYVFAAGREYLKTDLQHRLFSDQTEIREDFLEMFVTELLNGGIFGGTEHRNSFENQLLKAGNGTDHRNRLVLFFKLLRNVIFVRREDLSARYQYAKQNRLLLPLAWIHRLIHFVIRRRNLIGYYKKGIFGIVLSKERTEYLRSIGLLK